MLVATNSLHIYALHYVYLPRINQALKQFCDGWNEHGIRTAHNKSPCQLFVERSLQLRYSGIAAVDFFDVISESYGIEELGYSAVEDDVDVTLPLRMNILRSYNKRSIHFKLVTTLE